MEHIFSFHIPVGPVEGKRDLTLDFEIPDLGSDPVGTTSVGRHLAILAALSEQDFISLASTAEGSALIGRAKLQGIPEEELFDRWDSVEALNANGMTEAQRRGNFDQDIEEAAENRRGAVYVNYHYSPSGGYSKAFKKVASTHFDRLLNGDLVKVAFDQIQTPDDGARSTLKGLPSHYVPLKNPYLSRGEPIYKVRLMQNSDEDRLHFLIEDDDESPRVTLLKLPQG